MSIEQELGGLCLELPDEVEKEKEDAHLLEEKREAKKEARKNKRKKK
jgi:hypothetical protein